MRHRRRHLFSRRRRRPVTLGGLIGAGVLLAALVTLGEAIKWAQTYPGEAAGLSVAVIAALGWALYARDKQKKAAAIEAERAAAAALLAAEDAAQERRREAAMSAATEIQAMVTQIKDRKSPETRRSAALRAIEAIDQAGELPLFREMFPALKEAREDLAIFARAHVAADLADRAKRQRAIGSPKRELRYLAAALYEIDQSAVTDYELERLGAPSSIDLEERAVDLGWRRGDAVEPDDQSSS